jgi:anti-anti-sigma factor
MTHPSEFTVEVRHVVVPRREVDPATVQAVRQAMRAQRAWARVMLGLHHVEFMHSAGNGLIVEQSRRSERDGCNFAVVRGPDQVQKLFRIVGLAERLVVLDDVPGAADAGSAG